MPSQTGHTLALHHLDVSYGGVQAVRDLSLTVDAGEVVGLAGESGSGKSSVLRAVAGLLASGGRVSAGGIEFCGADVGGMSPRQRACMAGGGMAYVFQEPQRSLDPLFRVGSQFDECLRAHGVSDRSRYHEIACGYLREMGFSDPDRVLESYPHNLSGGMCQRVVLAMALCARPRLLLADEPTSALDVVSQGQVLDLLVRMREEHGMAMLVVSHDMAALAHVCDRIGVMYRGRLVEMGACERVLRAPEHPYTRNLIAAVPRADGTLPRLPQHWEGE